MLDTTSPVPAPATQVSANAPSGPVSATANCCPQVVTFGAMGTQLYGVDIQTNHPKFPQDAYWEPPAKAKDFPTGKDKTTRDGAMWVSVPIGDQIKLSASIIGCASLANCTIVIEPGGVASLVAPQSGNDIIIKGEGKGEATLKIMCEGKLRGYLHIWCQKMVTLQLGLGLIHVTSARHLDPQGAPMTTADPQFQKPTAADLEVALNDIYKQALVQFKVTDLGTVNYDTAPDLVRHCARDLVFDGMHPVMSRTGIARNSSDRSSEGAYYESSFNSLGDLTRTYLGNVPPLALWYLPAPNQAQTTMSGRAASIMGKDCFMLSTATGDLRIASHEVGHLFGLYHPEDYRAKHQFTPEDRLAALQNGNIVPNDPYNVMGYDANGTMLVYRQWVAMRESPHVEPPAS